MKKENGVYKGFVNDLLTLLEEKTGLEFTRVSGQWVENLERFKSKQTKMIADISYKKERELFTLFSKPYYEIPTLIFARDDFEDYKGIESFFGKKVGIQKDIFYVNEVKKIKGVELVINESIEQMAKDLSYGKTDIAIMNLLTMNYYIKKNALSNLRAIDELNLPTVNREDLRLGVNIDQPLLFSIIQKGMLEITPKEWRTLTNNWIGLNAKEIKTDKEKSKKSKAFLTKEQIKYLNSKKDLKICIASNWMPIEAIDDEGEHIGVGSDIKKILSEKIDKKIIHVLSKNWDQSLAQMKEKNCDILSLSKNTKSRATYLNFTKSLFYIPYVVVTKKDKFFIDNFDEIKNNKFAVVKSYAIEEDLRESYPDTEIIEVNSIEEGLDLVQNDEVYGYIDATAPIGYAIDKNEMYNLKIVGKLPIGYSLSYAVSKDNPELLKILEKVVSSINNEDKNRIYKKWIAVEKNKVTDYSLIWKIVLIALFFISLIIYWNRKVVKAKNALEKANKLLELAKTEIEDKNTELAKLATIDKLTGIYNRTKLDDLLEKEMHRSRRFNCNFGLCILDIDYFKSVNDNYGHLVGDKVLLSFAKLLEVNTRKTDFLGRWGGEEFIIIVPKTDQENLTIFAEKLRQIIESHNFEIVGKKTASIGLTLFTKTDTKETVIKRADDALYKVKNSGRNHICIL